MGLKESLENFTRDDKPGPDARVIAAAYYFSERMDISFPEAVRRFVRLTDHKGLLIVVWHVDPTPLEKENIEIAWMGQGESEDNVQHEVESDRK